MDTGERETEAEMHSDSAAGRMPDGPEELSLEATRQLLHELRVHQIELEKQNEELRRAQVALDASRARYFDLYELAPVGYVTLSESGLVSQANLTAAALLGVTRGDLVRQPFSRFIHEEDGDDFYLLRKQLFATGQPQSGDLRMAKADGTFFWACLDAIVAPDEGVPLIRIVISDITNRKHAEEALRQSETLHRSIVQTAEEGIWKINAASLTDYVNPKIAEMMGYTAEEMLGCPIDDFLDEEGRSLLPDHLARRRRGIAEQFEFKYLRKDGSDLWAFVSTNPITNARGEYTGALAMVTDITERKRTEVALKVSAEFRNSLIRSMQDGFSLLDATGIHLDANPALCRMTGFSQEELVGISPPFPYWPPEEYENIGAAFTETLNGNYRDFELVFLRKSGERFPVIVSPSAIMNGEGETINYIATVKDITERRKAEATLRETEELYRLLADNTEDIVGLNDTGGNRLYISPSYFRKTGWAPEDLARPQWRFIIHHDDIQVVDIARAKNLAGESTRIEHRTRCKDGSWLWCDTRCKPLFGADGEVWRLLVWSHDITERKAAEEALLESEEKFRTLYETASDAIFLVEGNCFVDCNTSTLGIFGCQSRDQIVGHSPSEFSPLLQPNGRESTDFSIEKITAAMTGEPQFFEWVHTRLDGTLFPAEVSLNAFEVGGHVLLQAIVRDISGRKKAESDLRESEEQFRAIFEQAAVGVAVIDSNTGRFLKVNQRACEIARLTQEEMLAETFMDLTHPDDLQADLDNMAKLKAGEIGTFTMEKRYLHADGSITWFSLTVSPMWQPGETPSRHIAVVQDITMQKASEEALRSASQKLRLHFEQTPLAVIEWDLDFRVKQWNPAALTIFGYSDEEAFGQHSSFLIPAAWHPRVDEVWQALLKRSGGERSTNENVCKDGRTILCEWYNTPLIDEQGICTGVASLVLDITERQRAEVELRASNEVLERRVAERTAKLRALAVELIQVEERERLRIADTLHEGLLQMLAVGSLQLGAVKDDLARGIVPAGVADLQHCLDESIKVGRTLTHELYPPALQALGLGAALIWLGQWYHDKYGMSVEVNVASETEVEEMELRIMLFRAVNELLVNVRKHGKVQYARVSLSRSSRGSIRLVVSDTGTGFDPIEVRAREGSTGGFGLFSLRERVEALGGSVRVRSAPGSGCRITLTIPTGKRRAPGRQLISKTKLI